MEDDTKLTEQEEQLLRLLEQDGSLTDQEIGRLAGEGAGTEEARLLWLMKKAVEREYAVEPDVSARWQVFSRRLHQSSRRARVVRLAAVAAVAAGLLLLFTLVWGPGARGLGGSEAPGGELLYAATDAPREVVITAGHGTPVSVAPTSQDDEVVSYRQLRGAVTETHTIVIPQGRSYKVILADGTEVWLNTGSRMFYPTRFVGADRKVELEGEAYFRVAPDAAHPFTVKAGDTYTQVLGTEFNIRSYTAADTHVTLVRGSVSVRHGSGRKVSLQPGEDARLTADGNFELQDVDTDVYTYWKDGYFYFDNESLASVMRQIGSWYNVSIVCQNAQVAAEPIHFYCNRNESVSNAVEQLNMLQIADFQIEDNTIYIK